MKYKFKTSKCKLEYISCKETCRIIKGKLNKNLIKSKKKYIIFFKNLCHSDTYDNLGSMEVDVI